MKKEYGTRVDNLKDLIEGGEIVLNIKDLNPGPYKYEARYVKAIVSSSPEQKKDWDTLWIRFPMGNLHSRPWAIKITQELGDLLPQTSK